MYLWSIEMEAVLTALAGFKLLCEEAELRCLYDDNVIHQLMPNYDTYLEFALTSSTLVTTGTSLP